MPQVEQYFGNLLPSTYWLGVSRASIGTDYTLTDGTAIQQVRIDVNFVGAIRCSCKGPGPA
jgi:hypothetical protein